MGPTNATGQGQSGGKPARVAVFGSINVDLTMVTPRLPEAGETLTARSFTTGTGGKGTNQAVAIARVSRKKVESTNAKSKIHRELGHATTFDSIKDIETSHNDHYDQVEVEMICAVGDDEFGLRRVKDLVLEGVGVREMRQESGSTGVAYITVEEATGENRILLNTGANGKISADWITSSIREGTYDVIVMQLEVPLAEVLRVIKVARECKVPVVFNPAPAIEGIPHEAYKAITHLILNETEAAILSGQSPSLLENEENLSAIAGAFLDKGVETVIITLGGKGAYFKHRTSAGAKEGRQAAVKVEKIVDTTGAGDTFIGAYVYQLAASKSGEFDIAKAVDWASKAAAVSIQREGALASVPYQDEIDNSGMLGD